PGTSGVANTDVYDYDAAGRMTKAMWWQGPSVTGTSLGSETYTRPNATKGMVSVTSPTGVAGSASKTNTYDGRNRLVAAGTESFAVDEAGNLTKGPDGRRQAFDPAQQLCWTSASATAGDCTTPTPSDATRYGYDERGNRISADPATGGPSRYSYDQANRLTAASIPDTAGGDGELTTFSSSRLLDTRGTGTGVCDPSPCARLASGGSVAVTL